jgi:hypothetical protein
VLNKQELVPTSAATIGLRGEGAYATTGSGSTEVWSASFNPITMGNQATVFCVAYSTAYNSTRKRAVRLSNPTNGTILALDYGNDVTNLFTGTSQVVGGTFPASDSYFAPDGNVSHSVVWSRNGTAHALYIGGNAVNKNDYLPSSANAIGNISQIFIGNSGSGFPLNGGVLVWGAWNRALSPDEVKLLSANPWQMFKVAE